MADSFEGYESGLEAPGSDVFSITPSDGSDLAVSARALLIGGSGALKVTTVDGTTITLPATVVTAGQILPLRVKRVFATGTDATDIHGIV